MHGPDGGVPEQLALEILTQAYDLDAANLEALARMLGREDWTSLTRDLDLQVTGTGGGFALLAAELPGTGQWLSLSDGEADLPVTAATFYLGISEEPGVDGLYAISVTDGLLGWRDGTAIVEGRLPEGAPVD